MDCPRVQKGCIDPIDYPQPQCQPERVRLSIRINISYMRDPTCNVSLFFFFIFFSFISVMSLLYMNETINQRLILVFFFSPPLKIHINFVSFHVSTSIFTLFIYLKLYEKLDNRKDFKVFTNWQRNFPFDYSQVVTLLILCKKCNST